MPAVEKGLFFNTGPYGDPPLKIKIVMRVVFWLERSLAYEFREYKLSGFGHTELVVLLENPFKRMDLTPFDIES